MRFCFHWICVFFNAWKYDSETFNYQRELYRHKGVQLGGAEEEGDNIYGCGVWDGGNLAWLDADRDSEDMEINAMS